MTKIELKSGYYIEVDEINATLKQKYTGKTKDGEDREADRTIGYYNNVTNALERFVRLNRLGKMDGAELSLTEYINTLKKADAEVKEFLQALKQMGE